MASLWSLTTVAGLGLALSLAGASGVAAQSAASTPSSVSPTTSAAPLSDAQIRSELRRLSTMKMECVAQAQQALAAQRAASAGGRLADVDAYGQTLKDKMACVDTANQDLLRLQTEVGPAKAALFRSEDRQAQLGALQRISEQLAAPELRKEVSSGRNDDSG